MLTTRPILVITRSTTVRTARPSLSPFFSRLPIWRSPTTSRSFLSGRASSSASRPLAWRPSLVRPVRNVQRSLVRRNTSKAVAQDAGSQAPRSLSDRFKELSRKYGWAAVGVYFGLSVLDFPFCFLAVRLIGPERIAEAEHAVVDGFWNFVGTALPSMLPEKRKNRDTGNLDASNHKDASIWTQLLLAYGVHKSLIFFRIPLTAAVTPKIVKTLRGWGWNIGKPTKTTAKS